MLNRWRFIIGNPIDQSISIDEYNDIGQSMITKIVLYIYFHRDRYTVCFLSARVTKSDVISDVVVKGFQERCIDTGDNYHGDAIKVMDDRGQLWSIREGYRRSAMATSKADFSGRLVSLPST